MEIPSFDDFIHSFLKPVLLASDPQSMIAGLAIFLMLLLFFSYMISGAEVAFFSLTYKDINALKTKQHPSAKRIIRLLDDPKTLLASLLIANSFINITIIIVANFLFDQTITIHNGFAEFLLKAVVITSILVLFGEVLPKVHAAQNNFQFAYHTSLFVDFVNSVCKGISRRMAKFSDRIEKGLGNGKANAYSLEELDQAIDLTTPQDATEEEKNILKGIIKFGNITVKQIMRSRLDVHGIDHNTPFTGVIKKVEELHYSRLPVYQNNLDNVVGMVHTKDLVAHLDEPADFDWHKLMRQPYFVHENKLIEDLLQEFQNKRIHFAVVVDEFGGTEGIVTLEDIMEEVVGEIKDEFDDEENVNRKIDENNFVFEGKTLINDACRLLELPPDTFDAIKGDSETMAGLLLEIAGEIPQVNQEIKSVDFIFTVLELEKNRIKKLKVTILSKPAE
ncbi:MAG: gliding motility-associated protein GldE [Chitinophagaceae bacterium]|nr:gliding motility-associated protein GldE [Chitinophagaceae bacterium]